MQRTRRFDVTTFLHGSELNTAITDILKQKNVSCAVAFWGKGAELLIRGHRKGRTRIICNLTMGGTNPNAMEEIMAKCPPCKVKQSNSLHAKVYVSDTHAIVASAN